MSDIQEANRYKALGNECFAAKNYHEAIKHFTKAIDLNSEDHVFYSNRSACYACLEEYDKALVDAQICVDINPDWAKGYLRRGLAEFYLKKHDQSEKTYKKGLELEPNNQQLQEGLQRVLEAKRTQPPPQNAPGGADKEKFFEQALNQLKENPETAGFFQDPEFISKLNEIKKNPQSAAKYLSDPKIQKAFEVLKSSSGKGGAGGAPRKGSGEEKKENSIKEAEEEKTRGNDEYKKKNFKQALQHYDKAIELNPKEAIYHNNKAAVYLEMKEADKVIECCNKAIDIWKSGGNYDPVKLCKALSRKASAYVIKKEYDDALKFYNQALKEYNDPTILEEIKKVEALKKN